MYRGAIPQSPSRWDHTDSIKLDSSHGLTRGPPIVFHQLTSVMTIVYRADATYSGTCTLLMCRKLKRRNLKSQKRQFSIIQAWGVLCGSCVGVLHIGGAIWDVSSAWDHGPRLRFEKTGCLEGTGNN